MTVAILGVLPTMPPYFSTHRLVHLVTIHSLHLNTMFFRHSTIPIWHASLHRNRSLCFHDNQDPQKSRWFIDLLQTLTHQDTQRWCSLPGIVAYQTEPGTHHSRLWSHRAGQCCSAVPGGKLLACGR